MKHNEFPWCFGANFTPSTAINQLEMWQADTFDPDTIDRELGWAAKIGMRIMRVFLHDLLWEQDAEGFCGRIERYLQIAAKHGIKTMFVFFDDCWRTEFALGKQPEPKPYTHNSGWVQSPGNRAGDDLAQRGRLESYVKGILTRFGNDERIALWDLYNEAGNGWVAIDGKERRRSDLSLPLLQAVFQWAREVSPSQPITSCSWNFSAEFDTINNFVYGHSDVVTFHAYTRPEILEVQINFIRCIAAGRPVLCSEYMARTEGSTFSGCLPILKKHNVSAVNWGLVSGKTQTIYPWEWTPEKGKPEFWFHDVFNTDGSLLYPEEGEVFANL